VQELETDRPVMKLGSCVFHGQHQHLIGTAVVFQVGGASTRPGLPSHPFAAAPSSTVASSAVSGLGIEAMTRRAIVFKRVSGDLGSLLAKKPKPK